MTRIAPRAVAVAVAAITATALGAGIAVGGTTARSDVVSFTSSWSGKATVTVTDNVADISADGTGQATLLGAATITGKGTGDSSVQPCVPFTGKGAMTSTRGSSSLSFEVVPGSNGCGDEAGNVFSVTGRATVTGGTGSLAKATGSLKLTGLYDRGAGTFSVKLAGKLTTAAAAAAAKPTVLKIAADPKKLAFSKKALTAPAGAVTIRMANPSALQHNVAIRSGQTAKGKILAKGKVVRKGGVSSVTATLKAGKYRYVCTVPRHEAAGMWGVLTVR